MAVSRPVAVLLVGLTGAGKTTLARALEARGLVRLSIDEEVQRQHGRYGVDYPEEHYPERLRTANERIRTRLVTNVAAGRSVVLDHGLWRRAERADWRRTIEKSGGRPALIYVPATRGELIRRLQLRTGEDDAVAFPVTRMMLEDFIRRFEPPAAGEGAITYAGDVEELCRSLDVTEL